jgi:23S rRNA (cytosine1962-C5)-methyltransferase
MDHPTRPAGRFQRRRAQCGPGPPHPACLRSAHKQGPKPNLMQALLTAVAQAEMPGEAQRIFHGRGGQHPGCEHWVLDAYPPVWLTTSFQPAAAHELAALHEALARRWSELTFGMPDPPALNWVHQDRITGGRGDTRLMAGSVPDPHVVQEDGTRYLVHVLRGQNHGLFLDMAAGRQWVRQRVAARPRQKVLNLFAYTCAFSVVALQAGARQVLNMDMSAGALAIGQRNHALNGITAGAGFMAHDIFKSWGKVNRAAPYDLVILDPPSYQKGSFVAEKDYARLLRRLPDLLAADGRAPLCLNAPELGVDFLQAHMQAQAPQLVFEQRLPNPISFADVAPERALKVLIYRTPD